jgi:hypothetical protein
MKEFWLKSKVKHYLYVFVLLLEKIGELWHDFPRKHLDKSIWT